jgi:hypothetical protein
LTILAPGSDCIFVPALAFQEVKEIGDYLAGSGSFHFLFCFSCRQAEKRQFQRTSSRSAMIG